MLATVLYALAAIAVILGFCALIGAIHLAIGWVGLFIAAIILAVVAYFLSGWRTGRAL